MKKIVLSLITISILGLSYSCKDEKKDAATTENSNDSIATTPDSEENTETATVSENLIADAPALKKAEDELKNLPKFKGKDIKIFQNVHFYEDGRIILALQDPEKPDNIDEYTFDDGKWFEPQAVQISGDGKTEDNVFPLSDIKFETVANIYKQIEEKAKSIEGGKAQGHIYYNLNVMNQTGQWYTNIDGTREKYSGYFNADGSLKEFSKN